MRVLLVTNDFPPTIGGIQSYLRDFISTLPPQDVVVFASTQDTAAAANWDGQAAYRVYRWPRRIMLPPPAPVRRMRQIIRAENIDVVWFGAAAPLALMARAARSADNRKGAGLKHIVIDAGNQIEKGDPEHRRKDAELSGSSEKRGFRICDERAEVRHGADSHKDEHREKFVSDARRIDDVQHTVRRFYHARSEDVCKDGAEADRNQKERLEASRGSEIDY